MAPGPLTCGIYAASWQSASELRGIVTQRIREKCCGSGATERVTAAGRHTPCPPLHLLLSQSLPSSPQGLLLHPGPRAHLEAFFLEPAIKSGFFEGIYLPASKVRGLVSVISEIQDQSFISMIKGQQSRGDQILLAK